MREGWELKSWEDVLEIRSGRNQKEVIDPNGKYPILGSAGNVMGYANDFLCDEGTTIVGRKGTIDNPLYIESKFWNVDTAFGLVAGKSIDKRFLYYFCRGFNFKELDKGTTLPSLVKKDLFKIQIPIPPLTEQKQIVSILDQAFAAIDQAKANIEKNIGNAKELFQSKLNEIFSQKGDGWEEKTLGEVCDLISGQHIDSKDYNTEEKGIGYLTGPSDFGDVYPLVSKWTEFPKRNAQKNDILITVKGSGVGSINLMREAELCISRQLMAVRCQSVQTKFAYAFLSGQFSNLQSLANGAAIPGISRTDVLGLKLSIPDQNIQKVLVMTIDNIQHETDSLLSGYRQKISNLEELKKSILQKAFAGELTEKEVVL